MAALGALQPPAELQRKFVYNRDTRHSRPATINPQCDKFQVCDIRASPNSLLLRLPVTQDNLFGMLQQKGSMALTAEICVQP